MRENDAFSFDRVARTYSGARPGYPREVYDFIDSWKSFGPDSRILEVGAGHGVATKEMRSYWDAELTADIEAVYAKYWPSGEAGADYRAVQLKAMEGRKAELEESGWFSLAGHRLIEHRLPFTQDRYID